MAAGSEGNCLSQLVPLRSENAFRPRPILRFPFKMSDEHHRSKSTTSSLLLPTPPPPLPSPGQDRHETIQRQFG